MCLGSDANSPCKVEVCCRDCFRSRNSEIRHHIVYLSERKKPKAPRDFICIRLSSDQAWSNVVKRRDFIEMSILSSVQERPSLQPRAAMPAREFNFQTSGFLSYTETGLTGVGNETVKLQNAINLASKEGLILVLPPFDVTVSQVFLPATGVQLWGSSGDEDGIPRSGIVSDGSNLPVVTCNQLSRRTSLRNLRIQGTNGGPNQHCLYLSDNASSFLRTEVLYLTNGGGSGLKIDQLNFSYRLDSIFSTRCNLHAFDIDALSAPCVRLENCYADLIPPGQYGYFIRRGNVQLVNCNGVGTGDVWAKVGDAQLGVAFVEFDHCNFEDFAQTAVVIDYFSNARFHACIFAAPRRGVVRAIYAVEPTGRAYIDSSTTFDSAGATWQDNEPIHLFRGVMDSPQGVDPQGGSKAFFTCWNEEDKRQEPLANLSRRIPTVAAEGESYIEKRPSGMYIGSRHTSTRTITLFDPASKECYTGREVIIKDESGNAAMFPITIRTVNSRNIDGDASAVINRNYGALRLVARNGQYWSI